MLAGAPSRDRLVVARPGSSTRWYEPMHVREPGVVRDEMTAQVVAGADVILAPTWITHRRALVAVGETRRARAWTEGAVSLARLAAEIGRESLAADRVVRILGVLPDPDAIDEEATGRQLRPDAAAERDERAQIGLLAESLVDGVLIEARPSLERMRVSVRAVAEHELAAWVVITAERPDGLPLGRWVDALAADGVGMILFEPEALPSDDAEPVTLPFGVLVPDSRRVPDPRGAADAWLVAGASVIGIAAEATPEALRPLVEARDATVATLADVAALRRASDDTWAHDAAQRATGGRALWVGHAPTSLPSGFDWTTVPVEAVGSMPPSTWRLIVSVERLDPRDAARLVERGGIVAAAWDDGENLAALARAAGLRLDRIDTLADGECRYLGRLED